MDIYSIGATFLKLAKIWGYEDYRFYIMQTIEYYNDL